MQHRSSTRPVGARCRRPGKEQAVQDAADVALFGAVNNAFFSRGNTAVEIGGFPCF